MSTTTTVSHEVRELGRPDAPGGIRVERLFKTFTRRGSSGEDVRAIDDVSLQVGPGELLVLLGPSGCGKTTLLRCVAGLEDADGGSIWIGGRSVYSSERKIKLNANERDISMIFQAYALWPHMTVRDNVAYPLQAHGIKDKAEIRERVMRVLGAVGLERLAGEYPGTLSGGQQQRLALARALVIDPAVILFDEPLSNVDAKVRHQLREEIRSMHARIGFAALYVTHDQEEALSLATRIAVLDEGKVVQIGTPAEIYNEPATRYVAEFVGRANILDCTVIGAEENRMTVESALGELDAPTARSWATGETAFLVVRPEDISIVALDDVGSNGLVGVVTGLDYRGTSHEVDVTLPSGERIRVVTLKSQQTPEVGAAVSLTLDLARVRVVDQ